MDAQSNWRLGEIWGVIKGEVEVENYRLLVQLRLGTHSNLEKIAAHERRIKELIAEIGETREIAKIMRISNEIDLMRFMVNELMQMDKEGFKFDERVVNAVQEILLKDKQAIYYEYWLFYNRALV